MEGIIEVPEEMLKLDKLLSIQTVYDLTSDLIFLEEHLMFLEKEDTIFPDFPLEVLKNICDSKIIRDNYSSILSMIELSESLLAQIRNCKRCIER